MARPKQMQLECNVSAGWTGEIARILEILAAGSADGTREARPLVQYLLQLARRDRVFMGFVAKQDRQAAANRLYRICRAYIQGGVKPINKPWALKPYPSGKTGDRRALRNARRASEGGDRVYRLLKTDPPAK